jgi:hypothetical protein
VKKFLIILGVSLVASVELWNLGLAAQIWPAHPLIVTTVFATVIAVAVQLYLSSDANQAKPAKEKSDISR